MASKFCSLLRLTQQNPEVSRVLSAVLDVTEEIIMSIRPRPTQDSTQSFNTTAGRPKLIGKIL